MTKNKFVSICEIGGLKLISDIPKQRNFSLRNNAAYYVNKH